MVIGDGDRDRSVFDRRYELRHGAESSSDPDREHAKLDVFLAPFSSLPFDDACAATWKIGSSQRVQRERKAVEDDFWRLVPTGNVARNLVRVEPPGGRQKRRQERDGSAGVFR